MNPTHLHLMLNHIPVIGVAFGLGILLFSLWRKSEELKHVALGLFVLTALLTVPVYLTGEPAEDGVKPFVTSSSQFIEQHEKVAVIAFTGVLVLGASALAGLLVFRRGKLVPVWFSSCVLVASFAVGALMAWTSNLGGQVHHTEIRSAVAPPAAGDEKDHF